MTKGGSKIKFSLENFAMIAIAVVAVIGVLKWSADNDIPFLEDVADKLGLD